MRVLALTLILFFLLADTGSIHGSANNSLFYKRYRRQATGTLYIQKLPASTYFLESPNEGNSTYYNSLLPKQGYNAYIEIAGVKKIKVTQLRTEVINGLHLGKRYLLKVYSADVKKQMVSFYFSFKTYGSTELRLKYDPFYNSWRFD